MVRNRYRILYYIPNPRHLSRYAIGLLYEEDTDPKPKILVAGKLPCACAFDFNQNHIGVIQNLLKRLGNNLPNRMEPSWVPFTNKLEVGPLRRYPSKVKNLERWFQLEILPR